MSERVGAAASGLSGPADNPGPGAVGRVAGTRRDQQRGEIAGNSGPGGKTSPSAPHERANHQAERGWDSFFEPRVVAVVGASADPKRIGGRLVRYSLESGFTGRIIPVNPNRDEVFGIPTKASVAEIDEPPDWVVVALPRDRVAETVTAAGELGARNVSVVAAGFAEQDEDGKALQQQVADIAKRYGMRLLGPNSNGFMNVASDAFFAFTPVIDSARPVAGELAIVTQSAAIGTYLVNWCRRIGLGVGHWFHTGNEADVTALELARVIAERGQARAVALSFETVRDLEDLYETLRTLAAAGIATAVLQAGTSTIGRLASQAHTAALIGEENELLGDLVASAGCHPAETIAGLVNFLQMAADHPRLPVDTRLGFVSTSGGVGVLMADAAEAHAVSMPALSISVQQRIKGYAPFSHPANPIDTTAQVINQPDAFPRILRDCVDSGELDLLAVFIAHGLAGAGDSTVRRLVEVARSRPDAAFAALGILSEDAATALRAAGVSAFAEPRELTSAIRAAVDARVRREAFARRPALDQGAAQDGGTLLDEVAGKHLLGAAGADIVDGGVVASADEAASRAAALGLPVVAKLISEALPHKANHGGVRLGLWTEAAVRQAYEDLDALGARLAPDDHRVLVERQLTGVELFVARTRHPRLGPLVGVGPGGSNVESAGAVRWQWGPVGPDELIASGAVGPAHAEAVAALIAAMTQIDAVTTETNPVFLTGDGRAVVADALIEIEPEGPNA